ncbi:hypothetical protein LCGC14_1862350 [marine sediment metagenome]|uniref:DUF4010 domain-containing protein n=1 Tax=marine sediment metagenome TaxID=412755 RepID=A0A0F9GVI5_9ZZZZ
MIEYILGVLAIFNLSEAVILAIATGFLRSFVGWANKSLEDGEIDRYELSLLGQTVFNYFLLIVVLSAGLSNGQAVAGALGLEYLSDHLI